MFEPRHCPHRDCRHHQRPSDRFFVRHGFFHPACRTHPVPRFLCRGCNRTFSRQTFRMDYRDQRPDTNGYVALLLCSGIGIRQAARMVEMKPENLAKKARKIARHCRLLNQNVARQLPADATLQFDELETYETRRNTRPLTLPVLIERRTRLILALRSAPIRPGGPKPEARRKAIEQDERRFGKRPSRSPAAVRAVLKVGARLCEGLRSVVLETDEKSSYPGLAAGVFGDRLKHRTTSSKLPRTTWNPLFPINHTEAVMRDLNGRLRRESWLVSKKRWYLNVHLHLYQAWRNLVRKRFNRDRQSPAQMAGWLPRRLRAGELLSWRQDFDQESGYPMAADGRSWREVRAKSPQRSGDSPNRVLWVKGRDHSLQDQIGVGTAGRNRGRSRILLSLPGSPPPPEPGVSLMAQFSNWILTLTAVSVVGWIAFDSTKAAPKLAPTTRSLGSTAAEEAEEAPIGGTLLVTARVDRDGVTATLVTHKPDLRYRTHRLAKRMPLRWRLVQASGEVVAEGGCDAGQLDLTSESRSRKLQVLGGDQVVPNQAWFNFKLPAVEFERIEFDRRDGDDYVAFGRIEWADLEVRR